MNLSILLTDFIDTKGMLKTYRFIPINQYNRIVVDRLSDICTDVIKSVKPELIITCICSSNSIATF